MFMQFLEGWAQDQGPTPMFRPPAWRWARAGDVGWWVLPEWRETLIGPNGLRLEEWRRDGRVQTIKSGPQRIVYRVELPQGTVFIKHFLVPGWRERIRQWVRRGKGRNEGRRAVRLAEVGVPTITPIALGEQRCRKLLYENFLISPELSGTAPLDEFLERTLPTCSRPRATRLRRQIAQALADLTARLHNAGIMHLDFHPGNLLLQLDDEDHPRLALIDLDALRMRDHLSWKEARTNLAHLNHYFWIRCSRSDRRRFLRAYLEARKGQPHDPKAFARDIEQSTRNWAERLWSRWGKRCLGRNKYYETYRSQGAWGIASRDLDPATMRDLLVDPDALFQHPEAQILKDSRTTTVAEVPVAVCGASQLAIYKRFNRKKWLEPFLTVFRPSRAWRAWRAGQHLLSRGIPTPPNLAIVGKTRRSNGRFPLLPTPVETYLLTLKAEPSTTLRDFLADELPRFDAETRRHTQRRLIRALAVLVRSMHERSITDRDLKGSNILIEGDPLAPEPRLSLIDLVGVQVWHPLPWHRRVQNLARLQISLSELPGWTRTDSLRLLRGYMPANFGDRPRWKTLWQAIARRSLRKTAQNRRRGRRLS